MVVFSKFQALLRRYDLQRRWLLLLVIVAIVDVYIIYRIYQNRSEKRFDKFIYQASLRYNVDPSLIKAVVWRESAFKPEVRGLAGELGLMQIREPAAREWAEAEKIIFFAHKDLLDPESNIQAGSWYLGKLMKRYRQTDNAIPYALADYNAGRTHVLRWMQGKAKTNSAEFLTQMDYPGTRRYIQAITERRPKYEIDFDRFKEPQPQASDKN